ncbi:MAG: hypothetical protein GY720_09900 [bacterium]|nr:hypothetical protein [bacterium]
MSVHQEGSESRFAGRPRGELSGDPSDDEPNEQHHAGHDPALPTEPGEWPDYLGV